MIRILSYFHVLLYDRALNQLTIVGCGVLGRVIVNGLLSEGTSERSYKLVLTHRRTEVAIKLQNEYPTALVTGDNRDACICSSEECDASIHIAIIATQPQYTAKVCQDITERRKTAGEQRQLIVVTVYPGITVSQLKAWLPKQTPIMRTMPNTPISVKRGATAIFSNLYMTSSPFAEVQLIFQSISPEIALLPAFWMFICWIVDDTVMSLMCTGSPNWWDLSHFYLISGTLCEMINLDSSSESSFANEDNMTSRGLWDCCRNGRAARDECPSISTGVAGF